MTWRPCGSAVFLAGLEANYIEQEAPSSELYLKVKLEAVVVDDDNCNVSIEHINSPKSMPTTTSASLCQHCTNCWNDLR